MVRRRRRGGRSAAALLSGVADGTDGPSNGQLDAGIIDKSVFIADSVREFTDEQRICDGACSSVGPSERVLYGLEWKDRTAYSRNITSYIGHRSTVGSARRPR